MNDGVFFEDAPVGMGRTQTHLVGRPSNFCSALHVCDIWQDILRPPEMRGGISSQLGHMFSTFSSLDHVATSKNNFKVLDVPKHLNLGYVVDGAREWLPRWPQTHCKLFRLSEYKGPTILSNLSFNASLLTYHPFHYIVNKSKAAKEDDHHG